MHEFIKIKSARARVCVSERGGSEKGREGRDKKKGRFGEMGMGRGGWGEWEGGEGPEERGWGEGDR